MSWYRCEPEQLWVGKRDASEADSLSPEFEAPLVVDGIRKPADTAEVGVAAGLHLWGRSVPRSVGSGDLSPQRRVNAVGYHNEIKCLRAHSATFVAGLERQRAPRFTGIRLSDTSSYVPPFYAYSKVMTAVEQRAKELYALQTEDRKAMLKFFGRSGQDGPFWGGVAGRGHVVADAFQTCLESQIRKAQHGRGPQAYPSSGCRGQERLRRLGTLKDRDAETSPARSGCKV
jgi:hypothetical protein